jgi:hypothetical protein
MGLCLLLVLLFEFWRATSISSVPLNSIHVPVDLDVQFGFILKFKFHDFIYIQFWCQFIWKCNLVLMFRFPWVTVGSTCSALPVNAKDSSSSVSDENYYFKVLFVSDENYCSWMFWFFIHGSHFVFLLPVLNVLAECFYSPLCLFGF